MSLSLIYPPFNEEQIGVLMEAPVALYVDGHEEKRGVIIGINLRPSDEQYSAILEIEFSEYEGCTLGFIERQKKWTPVEQDIPRTLRHETEPLVIDIRYVSSTIYALD